MDSRRKFLKKAGIMGVAAGAALSLPWQEVAAQTTPQTGGTDGLHYHKGRITPADRKAAAARAQAAHAARPLAANLTPVPGGTPDYWGPYPNWANTQRPQVVAGVVTPGTGVRKFVDTLPQLNVANNLGQMLNIAVADTTTYTNPPSDYYEIGLVEYSTKMHSDLPPTKLRGYVQLNDPAHPITRDANGKPTSWPQPNYLGPIIIAQKNRPVRVKFYNLLPTGAAGDLFIPTDTTYMGAGMAPDGTNYAQNRATIHLHGGLTPWISDGTPHQWTVPAGEVTNYKKGASTQDVPDMPATKDGEMTFFYTNQQSARLMFYHDHAYGTTRLNVYAGMAAGYVLQDPVEADLVNRGIIPAQQIPLVIQDRTFVPTAGELAAEDPTWDTAKYGSQGNLWFSHVYMVNQNPWDISGAAAMGRWDYSPWFWPPMVSMNHQPLPNPYTVNGELEPMIPGFPIPSGTPEAFMDTPLVNGTAYPMVSVHPQAYRFRILNACNDRMLNLQMYLAASQAPMWNRDANGVAISLNDANAGEVPMVPAASTPGFPPPGPPMAGMAVCLIRLPAVQTLSRLAPKVASYPRRW